MHLSSVNTSVHKLRESNILGHKAIHSGKHSALHRNVTVIKRSSGRDGTERNRTKMERGAAVDSHLTVRVQYVCRSEWELSARLELESTCASTSSHFYSRRDLFGLDSYVITVLGGHSFRMYSTVQYNCTRTSGARPPILSEFGAAALLCTHVQFENKQLECHSI